MWIFGVKELEKGKIWGGVVKHVVDGDTVDVSFDIYGIQRIRLVGVNSSSESISTFGDLFS